MATFLYVIYILCQVLTWAIVIRAVLSWFSIRPDNPILNVINLVTEPILAPLRRVVPRIGMIDLAPMVAIVLLFLIPLLLYSIFD